MNIEIDGLEVPQNDNLPQLSRPNQHKTRNELLKDIKNNLIGNDLFKEYVKSTKEENHFMNRGFGGGRGFDGFGGGGYPPF